LPRHCSADEYQARRCELDATEVNRRLLTATGISSYFIDTGYRGSELLTPEQVAEVSGQSALISIRNGPRLATSPAPRGLAAPKRAG
jgi:hypothetical protein